MTDSFHTLNKMKKILDHRGPDDFGYFIKNEIALGHCRLSIIDLTHGHQPMFSPDKKQVIIYNGEIYNFQEIKNTLLKKGHHFQTNSDTEVILKSYYEWGYKCLDKFNGMFAFALWDENKDKLWLARDRIGVKPLYYLFKNRKFYFASEGKALWNIEELNLDFDYSAINQYLTFRYVPLNQTFLKDINKLPPGHWMLIDAKTKDFQINQWWSFPKVRENTNNKNVNIDSYCEEFSSLFSSAVKHRMISDVPLGLFLSSGIDSASIAIEMSKIANLKCFTVGFGENIDEIENSKILANELGATQKAFLMDENDFDLLDKAVGSMDEPYGDPIILPTYILAKKAAQEVKVVLTGDGADEIIGGYIHHVFFNNISFKYPRKIFNMLSIMFKIMPIRILDLAFNYPASMGRIGKERLVSIINQYPDIMKIYMNFATLFTHEEKGMLLDEDIKNIICKDKDDINEKMISHFNRKDAKPLDLVIQWDLMSWFVNQTMMKLDRLSMAHSLEGRSPYVDYRLIEFFLKMPYSVFSEIIVNKNIIRKYYQNDRYYLAKKKKPFYFPLHGKFRNIFMDYSKVILNKEFISKTGLFNFKYIESLFANRSKSPLLVDKQIMSLVILMLWLKSYKNMKVR